MIIEKQNKEPYKNKGGIQVMRRAFMSITLLVLSLSRVMVLLMGLVATV